MTLTAWKFFPLYGLKLEDDDGLEDPIFGGATLLDRDWLRSQVAADTSLDPKQAEIASLGDMTALIGDWSKISAPREAHVSFFPPSVIAIRQNDADSAEMLADQLRLLLTATMFLRGRRLQGFAKTPHEVSWSTVPKMASAPSTNYKVVGANFVIKKTDPRE